MKKYLTLLAAAALLLPSCKSKTQYGEIKNIAPYLYEITYTDIDEGIFNEVKSTEAKAACSSVRNGAFHGRNLDLFYNEGVEVVAHISASKDRFASVAVCGGNPDLKAEVLEAADPAVMARIPFMSLDGINENHVAVNVNVVPAVDKPISTGTNPGARRIHMGTAPRYILNHAESAAHAVELLQGLDLFGGFGDEFGLHLMISDPKETYIVEIIDNKLQYYKGERENPNNIMTNLYSTLLPEITPHAEGVERYGILQANYAEGCTEDGMVNLMKRVKYSQAYVRTTDPFWYSEGHGVFTEPDGTVLDININTPHEVIMASIEDGFEAYERHERKGEFWQTVNTSIYNLDEASLLLFVQEDYDHSYRFSVK